MYHHEAYIYSQASDGFMETGKAKTEQEDLTANIFSIDNTTIVGTLYFQMACSFEFRLFVDSLMFLWIYHVRHRIRGANL